MRIIIATSNQGKLKEIVKILKQVRLEIVCLADLDKKFHVKENGSTFAQNAIKKTKPVSLAYPDDLVVGEDSGLEVQYLGDKPGVHSKRYGGKNTNDLKNNILVLKQLEKVPGPKRTAWFCCALALMKNGKILKTFNGKLKGRIHNKLEGVNGFGYDSIFYLPKYKKTTGQLTITEKNKISHRFQAFKQLRKYLTYHAKNDNLLR